MVCITCVQGNPISLTDLFGFSLRHFKMPPDLMSFISESITELVDKYTMVYFEALIYKSMFVKTYGIF